jgi:hypothetical protein
MGAGVAHGFVQEHPCSLRPATEAFGTVQSVAGARAGAIDQRRRTMMDIGRPTMDDTRRATDDM